MCGSFKPLASETEKASIAKPMPNKIAFRKNKKSILLPQKNKKTCVIHKLVLMYNKYT